jgi:hypothetical protein
VLNRGGEVARMTVDIILEDLQTAELNSEPIPRSLLRGASMIVV